MGSERLAGRTAIVTGASVGIGAAIARRLAADGARTVVNFKSEREPADAVVTAIKAAGGEAVAIQADVSEVGQVAKLFHDTVTAFGRVSLLVNNAAVRGDPTMAADIQVAQYHDVFAANVQGPLLCMIEF